MWQTLLKSGAHVVNGTDVPVEPINPIACFFASVTRQTLKGEPAGGYEHTFAPDDNAPPAVYDDSEKTI